MHIIQTSDSTVKISHLIDLELVKDYDLGKEVIDQT